jgi:ankyrin repeat protein
MACWKGHFEVVKLLLEKGANAQQANKVLVPLWLLLWWLLPLLVVVFMCC